MKVFILFFCFTYSYAFDFDCLKGPSFWCANEINVLKCGRIKECSVINDGVVKMSKIEQSDYCKLCEEVITPLGTILNSTITEKTFVHYVESNVCPKLGSENKEICLILFRQYGHEIYTVLKSLNPSNVCSIIQLYGTNKIINNSPKTCKKCKEVFEYIKRMLLSISPTELKTILKLALCEILPPGFRIMCDILVDQYTDQVYQLLKSILDGNRICPALHLCSNLIITKVSDWKDQTCLDVVTVLKRDLQSVSTDEVYNVVESKVCAKVPNLFKGLCNNLVGENIRLFMNKIHSTMSPVEICAHSISGSSESEKEKPIVNNDINCETCEIILNTIKKFISAPANQATIKSFLKKTICPLFKEDKNKCKEYVNLYFEIVMYTMLNNFDVKSICKYGGFCSLGSVEDNIPFQSSECKFCKIRIQEIIQVVTTGESKQGLEDIFIKVICPNFKNFDECTSTVNTFIPYIFMMICDSRISEILCSHLNLGLSITKKKMVSLMKSSKCEMCQFVINETKSFLSVQSMLEKFIKNVICIHSGIKRQECENSVTLYYSLLIKFVQSFLTPEICTEIHLCGSIQKTPSQPRKEITKNTKYIECVICKRFYLILKSINKNTSNMDIILQLVIICGSYSGDDKRECLNVLKKMKWLTVSINESKNEKQFCEMTHMCLAEAPLLLQKQCLVGPDFWCISRRNAQFCGIGAVKHCEFYFWKGTSTI